MLNALCGRKHEDFSLKISKLCLPRLPCSTASVTQFTTLEQATGIWCTSIHKEVISSPHLVNCSHIPYESLLMYVKMFINRNLLFSAEIYDDAILFVYSDT